MFRILQNAIDIFLIPLSIFRKSIQISRPGLHPRKLQLLSTGRHIRNKKKKHVYNISSVRHAEDSIELYFKIMRIIIDIPESKAH
jgi:hypothetical protein